MSGALVKISKHAKSTSVNSYTPFHCSVIAAINKLILNIQSLQQSTPVFISHHQSAPQDLAGGAIVKYQGQVMEQVKKSAVEQGQVKEGSVEGLMEPMKESSMERRKRLASGASAAACAAHMGRKQEA